MYRVYELTEQEKGKIYRRRWDGDTYYWDVYDSPEELEKESERLRKIKEEAERAFEDYLESLKREEEEHKTPETTFKGSYQYIISML